MGLQDKVKGLLGVAKKGRYLWVNSEIRFDLSLTKLQPVKGERILAEVVRGSTSILDHRPMTRAADGHRSVLDLGHLTVF